MISWEFSENFQKKLLQWLSSFLLFRAAQKRKKKKLPEPINIQVLQPHTCYFTVKNILRRCFPEHFPKISENVCFQNTPGRLFLGKHMKHVVCHASHSMHVEIILKICRLPH